MIHIELPFLSLPAPIGMHTADHVLFGTSLDIVTDHMSVGNVLG